MPTGSFRRGADNRRFSSLQRQGLMNATSAANSRASLRREAGTDLGQGYQRERAEPCCDGDVARETLIVPADRSARGASPLPLSLALYSDAAHRC